MASRMPIAAPIPAPMAGVDDDVDGKGTMKLLTMLKEKKKNLNPYLQGMQLVPLFDIE